MEKKNKTKRVAVIATTITAVILFAGCTFGDNPADEDSVLWVSDTRVMVELAETSDELYAGLSFRDELCENCGMLFLFNDSARRAFVMRNMNFPLDIIWIRDGVVTKIDKNLPPEGENPVIIYKSKGGSDMVLEVNAGFADINKIKAGDKIRLNR